MSKSIDCIVVGYNDVNIASLLERNQPFHNVSGGYRHLLANSVNIDGKRMGYFGALNAARREAGLSGETLHVAKMPNLGVHYLVSYLRKRGLQAELINFFSDSHDKFMALLDEKPKSVAITTTFYYEPHPIREIVDFVRQHSPETKIIVGGPHIYNVCNDNDEDLQEELLDEMGADIYVFDSQGEATLGHLCQQLQNGSRDLDSIPNLVWKEADQSYGRSRRASENNAMDATAVDWRLFAPETLVPTVQTRTARSCAYKCAFCRYPVMAGNLDLMSLDAVESELDYLQSIGVQYVLFIDDTFNIPANRFKDMCRLMIRKRYGFKWFSYFRCANADRECFDLMEKSGCAGVFLGIESGDDGVLKAMNKIATAAKYRDGIRQLNDRGIITHASFIVGHPGEDEASAARTLEFIDTAQPMFFCMESFFYDTKVPIADKAAEYEIQGRGYAWKHKTMTWQRASEIVEEGYRTLNNSVVLPLYSFDLWSLAYLLGKGVPLDTMTEFLKTTSRAMIDGLSPTAPPLQIGTLAEIFRKQPRSTAGAAEPRWPGI